MSEYSLIEAPQVVHVEEQKIAKIYAKVPTREIQQQMGALLREVSDVLVQQKIKPTGPWFTHHLRRPDEFFDFEVCFPVAEEIIPSGRVQPGVWPAMEVVRTVYTGGYQELGAAWSEFVGAIDLMELKISPEIYEVYLVGPDSEADPTQWKTQLNRPLA